MTDDLDVVLANLHQKLSDAKYSMYQQKIRAENAEAELEKIRERCRFIEDNKNSTEDDLAHIMAKIEALCQLFGHETLRGRMFEAGDIAHVIEILFGQGAYPRSLFQAADAERISRIAHALASREESHRRDRVLISPPPVGLDPSSPAVPAEYAR